jgi:3,4-dihydroxy 2-butanone 4-phosphate synthase/GTP cyclohydrolase II
MDSCVEGIVVEGDRRGRKLGFPTANVRIGPGTDLADGVYAGIVELADGSRHLGAVSVGRRPQYYDAGERLLEAHLLDFDGDIYGEKIRVEIGNLVRGQMVFESEDQLVKQIASDVESIRTLDVKS